MSVDDTAPEDPLGPTHTSQRGDGVAQLSVELLRALGKRDPCRLDLERRAQRKQVVQLFGVERRHARAAVGLDPDESLGGEPLQGAAHRHTSNVIGLDERPLH